MLARLIKHNLKPIFKSILPYIILLCSAVILFNITAYEIEPSIDSLGQPIDILPSELQQFLHGLADFLISCSLILLFASAIRSILHRFKTNFYSDEAYLTHTLPISRRTLWNAQICSICIVFTSILAILISNCLLLALTKQGQQLLQSFGLIGGCSHCFGEYYYIEPQSFWIYAGYVFAIFTELAFLTICGMSGIIISNHFSKNISLIASILIYLAGSIILIGILFVISTVDANMIKIFDGIPHATPGYNPDLSPMAHVLTYIGAIYACYCIALYFVDQHLLSKGVNLD